MIDFVKILLSNFDYNNLLNNPLLDFKGQHYIATGEVQSFPLIAEYHCLKFDIKSKNTILLSGSFHKYWNSINGQGEQNYNDFTFLGLVSVILSLKEKFKIDIFSAIIQNIEFGVNIITPYNPNVFLKSLINHKGQSFNKEQGKYKYYLQCEKQRYIVKIYNKGLQNNLYENILRFEIKIIKMVQLKQTKINSLEDLLDIKKLIQLESVLMTFYNDLLIYDNTTNTGKLNARELNILNNGRNPKYWDELKETSENNYYKKRERFNVILNNCNGNILKETTGKLISEKWKELSKVDEITLQKLTDFDNTETLQELTDFDKQHFTEINHSSIGLIPSISYINKIERKCLICGNDISHKKKIAKYCSKKCKNDHTNPILNPKNNLIRRIGKVKKHPKLFEIDSCMMLSFAQQQILNRRNSILNNHKID